MQRKMIQIFKLRKMQFILYGHIKVEGGVGC